MKEHLHQYAWIVYVFIIFFTSCDPGSPSSEQAIQSDSISIAKGRLIFSQNCSYCHNIQQNGIGPGLAGLTEEVPVSWLAAFIRDPKKMIDSGDTRSKDMYAKYQTIMPSFNHLKEEDIDDIIAFLHTHKSGERIPEDTNALRNPIPGKIKSSGIIAELELATKIPASSEKQPLTRIIKIGNQPGSDKLFVLDLRGKLYQLSNGELMVYFDMQQQKKDFISQPGLATGFGSFAFHPAFKKNGLFYTTHTEPAKTAKADFSYHDSIPVVLQWVITEWKSEDPSGLPFKGTSRELFRIDMVTGMHGVQEITFNPFAKRRDEDYGLLYIGIGDGASVENKFPFLVQSVQMPWGTILRIDPTGNNSANGKYGIPASNPFAKAGDNTIKEIYAYGFRNPHKITWTKDGRMIACNIGQAHSESLYIIEAGHNYGWPIREGSFLMNPKGNIMNIYPRLDGDSVDHITYPVAEYDHDEGKAISGGYEYLGSAVPEFKGKFIFGDINNGRLFLVEMKDLKQGQKAVIKEWNVFYDGKATTMADLSGNKKPDMRFGRDLQGELYISTKTDGKVYKVTAAKNNRE